MRIILTGSSGYIGGSVLKRCIEHPSVTSIIALSRRDLETSHSKLETIILKDFASYEPAVLARLKDAEACIWSLGSYGTNREIHVDLPVAGIKALYSAIKNQGRRFHFVYLSGGLCERDQAKTLWFMPEARHMRGEAETKLLDFQNEHSDQWQSTIVRPLAVTNGESLMRFVLPNWYIPLAELAAAMVDLAINGSNETFLENADVRAHGQAALTATESRS
ncbi:Hypothetical protein R9X50_00309500 [Acrodontium crateriforme]|uniref:NAD(P)-binding domain-containing protein n=1 Tax=Acrodontium crateriforme TaxID=150365 RepID=A0AAQ3R970_9PEZI|nr:Hypothetical protein R9X50_00309500 [Acrodontium crateriforme]